MKRTTYVILGVLLALLAGMSAHHYLLGNAQWKCVGHDRPSGRGRADASVACL